MLDKAVELTVAERVELVGLVELQFEQVVAAVVDRCFAEPSGALEL